MLKKVVIQGFKSFAEKTEITFEPSITGIVGPNGSGKSNVAEAIRWALGETKTKILRSERQQDVIFTGSQGRKPVGMAEVTLILDNSNKHFPLPYAEIAITRRFFRSGESEFYINKSPCRLKDIHELLVDTGLGKHGYAIIGQGQVDEILFSSPEEKRSYLEEAAGINRFRMRELEAKKKLLETQNGITRLNDLTNELTNQLQAKEQDVIKAKTYLTLKEKLTFKAKNYYGIKIKNLLDKVRENEEKITLLHNLIEKNQDQVNRLEASFAKILSEEGKLGLFSDNLQKIVLNLESCLEKLDNVKKYQQEEENRLWLELKSLKEQIKANGRKLVEINQELNSYQRQVKDLKAKEREIIGNLKVQKQKLGINEEKLLELKKSLENCKDEQFELNFREVSLRNEINFISDSLTRLTNDSLKIEKDIYELNREIGEIENTLRSLNDFKKENLRKREVLKNKRKKLEEELNLLAKNILILQNEKRVLEKKYNENITRLQILTKLEESYEGYGKDVKNLFEAKKSGLLPNPDNIIGTVGEFLEVDERYRLAVETALGAGIKNVIVKSSRDLEGIIRYLKLKNLGRITFLALDLLETESLKGDFSNLTDSDGFIGTALDLISFPQELSKAYESLLGKVLVGKDYQSCLIIAKKTKHRYKVVSLEGELLLPGGIIIGGSFNQTVSVLQRKNEIKLLQKQVDELLQKNNEVEEALSAFLKKQEDIDATIKLTGEKLSDIEAQLTEADLKEQNIKDKRNLIESRLIELKGQLDKNNREKKNLLVEKENREQQINNIISLKKKLEEKIAFLEKEISRINDLIYENQNYYQELTLQQVQLEKALENIFNLINEKSLQKKELFERQKVSAKKALEFKNKILNLKKDFLTLERKIAAHGDLLSVSKKYFETVKNKHEELKDKLSEMQTTLTKTQKLIQKHFAEISRLETEQRNLLQEINRLKLLLNEKYDIVLGDEEVLKLEPVYIEEREIEELYNQIQGLGPVNLFVIDEVKRLEERINFLNQQRNDLNEAKEQLEKLLSQLTEEMEQRFNEFLKLLNEEYDLVFKELFGGGRAALEKVVGEDQKEGIEIIVELPGKKRQPLGLLSGGERALASIALLFALFNLKPSPFCVLDEIDAALDEANVQRFAAYLKKIGERNQVILITHRRGSMEVCAKLIGISMQDGCSKVLSLPMENIKAG
ncbi:chromosome segregation protein SMC [Carboxydothermus hydrogenoformans]|uniref:Chromosome partition protein Smc n=1 Tax=Carboxydothermus hydrogenoformans (strain ATCC BAA-161 / DSM 6008 / Z-2901) TaxID=246194 RepID=Q3AC59_CARHZ|nr:chromosome segregation protein SMC [Carboxydothermus hydrogenoformans]ABB16024.1 chromosome segregation protein SMC [Carboxydothermus hydrogenoformans Z-2901]